jgi:toxin ParE1/3/4
MAYRVRWSSRALSDLEAIAAYIEADSPAYARSVVKKIISATRQLSQFPRSGREVPEFENPSIRELIIYSYRIIYKLDDSVVTILSVIHGKQRLH